MSLHAVDRDYYARCWKLFSVGTADANEYDEITLSAWPGISRGPGGMPPKVTRLSERV